MKTELIHDESKTFNVLLALLFVGCLVLLPLLFAMCCLLVVVVRCVWLCCCFVNTELLHDEYNTSNVIAGCYLLLALLFVVGLLLLALLFAVC